MPRQLLPVLMTLLMLTTQQLEPAAGASVSYSMQEERPTPHRLGNLVDDSGLAARWNTSVRSGLRFRVMRAAADPLLPASGLFDVTDAGDLLLASRLDREATCAGLVDCTGVLQVATAAPAELFTVRITVEDVNDNAPEFVESPSYTMNVSEASSVGQMFALPAATDTDSPRLSVQSYRLEGGAGLLQLVADGAAGGGGQPPRVRLLRPLDRERESRHAFVLRAIDGGLPSLTGTLSVILSVLDENDEAPRIVSGCVDVSQSEDAPAGSTLSTLVARDADVGRNAELRWRIRSVEGACQAAACRGRRGAEAASGASAPLVSSVRTALAETFSISPTDGTLILARRLDYESYTSASVAIEVTDLGAPPRTAECILRVLVSDANDNQPAVAVSGFGPGGGIEAPESEPPGRLVGYLFAEDSDSGEAGRVTCESRTPQLRLVQSESDSSSKSLSKTYQLVTSAVFDREASPRLLWTVSCRDNGSPPQVTESAFNVSISDVNDHSPTFGEPNRSISIDENGPAGQLLLDLHAADPDAGDNGRVSYSIEPAEAAAAFRIHPNGTLVSAVVLDRETRDVYEFSVTAVDHGVPQRSATAHVRIRLADVNDCAPEFPTGDGLELKFRVSEAAPRGALVGRAAATDRDLGDSGRVSYAAAPPDPGNAAAGVFEVERDGSIRVTGQLDRETQDRYFIGLIAHDHGRPQLNTTATATVFVEDVNDNSPVLQWPTPLNHSAGVSYLAPLSTVVCRVEASDADDGANAALEFVSRGSSGASVFSVNATTGSISLTRRLSRADVGSRHELHLEVRDGGEPPKSTLALILIIVDDSQLAPPSAAGLSASELNFLLIIVICSVTFVLSCVLVASIWHTRRRLVGGGRSGGCGGGNSRCYGSGGGGAGKAGGAEDAAAAAKLAGESPPPPGTQPPSLGPTELSDGTRLGLASPASLIGRSGGDFVLPMRQYREYDYIAPSFGPAVPSVANNGSGQSSESDSGRGTCFIDDDPFRDHGHHHHVAGGAGSQQSAEYRSLTISPRQPQQQPQHYHHHGVMSTFTLDREGGGRQRGGKQQHPRGAAAVAASAGLEV